MKRINRLCILGGHIQALGLARQAKKKGVAVTLIIADGFSVARFSRYVDKVYICRSEEHLINCLNTNKSKCTLLFPTSDEYIDFIVRHFSALNETFLVALPELATTQLFADKSLSYKFAKANNIPHPWCKYPQSLSDVHDMASQLEYPVVIKPAVMYDFHKQFGKKAYLCESKEELLLKTNALAQAGYPVKALILQEYLSGGAKNLYSFGFFAVNGNVKSSITVNRIRQNPMDFGNSTTFALTTDIPQIEDIAKRIIHLTNYTGMGEVEFMYDKGEYKFLEVNTRAWKWHTITDGQGFSFIGDWIDWLNRESLTAHFSNDCAWVERITDYAVILKGIFKKQIKLGDVIRSYGQRKISAVWSLSDPLPAIMYALMSPILYVKRY